MCFWGWMMFNVFWGLDDVCMFFGGWMMFACFFSLTMFSVFLWPGQCLTSCV